MKASVTPFKPGNQNFRGLSEFYAGNCLHRFGAEKIGIHALPSFISSLEKIGLRFGRKPVRVPTRFGKDASVMLYWLAPESFGLAAQYLGKDRQQSRPPEPPENAALLYAKASRG